MKDFLATVPTSFRHVGPAVASERQGQTDEYEIIRTGTQFLPFEVGVLVYVVRVFIFGIFFRNIEVLRVLFTHSSNFKISNN